MMRQSIIPYFDLCTGCRICELACSSAKFGVYAPSKAHIAVFTESRGLRSQPVICIQCENAPCIRACPVGAIQRDERIGAVVIDEDKCTGCRLCVSTCPTGAIHFDAEANKATKCDLCNGEPVCVKYCPTKALFLK